MRLALATGLLAGCSGALGGCGRIGFQELYVPPDDSPGTATGDTSMTGWAGGATPSGGASAVAVTGGNAGAALAGGAAGAAATGGAAGEPVAGGTAGVTAAGGAAGVTASGGVAGVAGMAGAGGSAPTPTCSDGIQNQDETSIDCGGAICPPCGTNTPPAPAILVSPGAGWFDGASPTRFQADATGTRDREDAAAALSYSWDWDSDGTFEPGDVGVTPPAHTYGAAGTYEVVLRVEDTGGLFGYVTFAVVVRAQSNVLIVTTPVDENDGGATPTTPGGTGLSLREAIHHANTLAGAQSILVPNGYVIDLASTLPLSTDAAGLDVVGDGAVIDGSAIGGNECIFVNGDFNRYFGLEVRGCGSFPFCVAGGTGNQFARGYLHDNHDGVLLDAADNTFGPGNELARNGVQGIEVRGANDILWNYIHDHTARGIFLPGDADGSLVLGNVVSANGAGIYVSNGADNVRLIHNTVYGNASAGFDFRTNISGTVLQNNVVSHNAQWGLSAGDGDFATRDHNDFFANGSGWCSNCSVLGTGSLTDDPLYVNAAGGDFRLRPASTLVDAGTDTGNDLNGPDAGNYNGLLPDIGAFESP